MILRIMCQGLQRLLKPIQPTCRLIFITVLGPPDRILIKLFARDRREDDAIGHASPPNFERISSNAALIGKP